MSQAVYTTRLGAGLGLVTETQSMLRLLTPGMAPTELLQAALASGEFPNVSGRRLRNIVQEAFAPRYMTGRTRYAEVIRQVQPIASKEDLLQLMLLCTCRANAVLADFVRDIYWPAYSGGKSDLGKSDGVAFVSAAVSDGITTTHWSQAVVTRVGAYLLGACADFGLLGPSRAGVRPIRRFQITPLVASILAHELHSSGAGDNALVRHQDWLLFGLEPDDVLDELKRMSLRGELLVQAAGSVISISWRYKTLEGYLDGISALSGVEHGHDRLL